MYRKLQKFGGVRLHHMPLWSYYFTHIAKKAPVGLVSPTRMHRVEWQGGSHDYLPTGVPKFQLEETLAIYMDDR